MPAPKLELVSAGASRIAAPYIRCSTDLQEDSPETQRHYIEAWAARCGYVIPEDLWFIDFAESSGKPTHKRPAGHRLLTEVAERKTRIFDTVIILCLDRAFRDVEDQIVVWGHLDRYGVELVASEEDLSRDTAAKRMMLTVKASFNQHEREVTGERIKRHNTVRHRKGLNPSGRPVLGLARGDGPDDPFVTVPGELAAAIRIFEIYAQTCGNSRETAAQATREGLTPRSGAQFWSTTIRRMVRGPQYRRMQSYGAEPVLKPGIIPETIPPELLARVDAILTAQYGGWWHGIARPYGHGVQRARGVYTGLLACGLCGAVMDVNLKPGNEAARFRCRSWDRARGGCSNGSIHGPTLDRVVGEMIHGRLSVIKHGEMSRPVKSAARQKHPETREAKLESLVQARARVIDLYTGEDGPMISKEDFKRRHDRLTEQIREMEAAAADVPAEVAPVTLATAETILEEWESLWVYDLASPAKREILAVELGVSPRGITVYVEPFEIASKPKRRMIVTMEAARLQPAMRQEEILRAWRLNTRLTMD